MTGAVTLRAALSQSAWPAAAGMFVRAVFSQATNNNGILVPQAAVNRDPQGNATVMLVGADNKPISRPVVTTQTVAPTGW